MDNATNAGDAIPAGEENVGNLLNIDVNALPENVDLVPMENAQQLALLEFVGQWQFIEESGDDLAGYVEEFGCGFLYCLHICSFG